MISQFAQISKLCVAGWVKWPIYLAGGIFLLSVLWFAYWRWHDEIKQSGIDQCQAEAYQATRLALEGATKRIEQEYTQAINDRQKRLVQALDVIERLEDRQPEIIYKEIPKIVQAMDCKHLGPGFVRVYNQAIGHIPNI